MPRTPNDSTALLSVPEAADYLGMQPGTLRNWLSAKRLPYVKVGRLTRLSRRALDAFIESNTVDAHNSDLT
jgi:excisionase family DNA binding protein